uniref:Neprosin PEP catalytic domain-containing protein n=1 Tax=Oryza nivara TaxID=4536 RepID=A0A0E0HL05_ORYNI
MNYIMVGYTLDKDYRPYPSSDPPKTLANQIVVGLVAWPALYGDSLSRLFIYYTNDSGAQTNCFNLDCDGFHLQNSSFALGSSWSDSLSQHGGERYGVTLSIHRVSQINLVLLSSTVSVLK